MVRRHVRVRTVLCRNLITGLGAAMLYVWYVNDPEGSRDETTIPIRIPDLTLKAKTSIRRPEMRRIPHDAFTIGLRKLLVWLPKGLTGLPCCELSA